MKSSLPEVDKPFRKSDYSHRKWDEARVAFGVFSRELFGVDGFIIVWRLFWRISIVLLDSCLSSKALEMSSLEW